MHTFNLHNRARRVLLYHSVNFNEGLESSPWAGILLTVSVLHDIRFALKIFQSRFSSKHLINNWVIRVWNRPSWKNINLWISRRKRLIFLWCMQKLSTRSLRAFNLHNAWTSGVSQTFFMAQVFKNSSELRQSFPKR